MAKRPRRDLADLACASKLIKRLVHDLLSPFWIAGGAFVIDRQLFVCLIAMPRISDCVLPKLTCEFEIALTLREFCE
jgi:hypothetical protein